MESKEDEEVARRWRAEEMEGARQGRDMLGQGSFVRIEDVLGAGTKRRRIADKPEELVEVELVGEEFEGRPAVVGRKRKGRGA